MKNFLILCLLIFTMLLGGCTQEEPDSSAFVTETVKEESKMPTVHDKISSTNNTSENLNKPADNENKPFEQAPTKPENSPKPKDDSGVSIGTNQPAPKPEPPSEEKPKEESKEEQPPDNFFENNMMLIIAGVIVVLIIAVTWLIYDRKKMKTTINNLKPPQSTPPTTPTPQPVKPAPSPQQAATTKFSLRIGALQNIGSRKEQQDSFDLAPKAEIVTPNGKGLMAVVADGMGGLEGGAQISQIVTKTFVEHYNAQNFFEPSTFLYNAAHAAELNVDNYMNQTGVNGGSTVVAILIRNSQLYFLSVGDSHIYHLQGNQLKLINKEHNFAAILREKAARGEVPENEAEVNPQRNALTAYIGIGNFNTVDRNVHPINLSFGDKILLCSDGIYNALGDDALIRALTGDAVTAARRIHQLIVNQNAPNQDNFTGIILECIQA